MVRPASLRQPSTGAGAGAGASVAGADTAAASETGPARSPLSSSRATCPDVVSRLMSVSAQLFGLVITRFCAVLPFAPPLALVTDRASGYAVSRLNRSVIGCASYLAATGTDTSVPRSCPIPLTSTTMFEPISMPQSLRRAARLVTAGASARSGGSSMKRILPPFARYALSISTSPSKKSVFGPAMISTDASAGTCFSCASTIDAVPKLSEPSAAAIVL